MGWRSWGFPHRGRSIRTAKTEVDAGQDILRFYVLRELQQDIGNGCKLEYFRVLCAGGVLAEWLELMWCVDQEVLELFVQRMP